MIFKWSLYILFPLIYFIFLRNVDNDVFVTIVRFVFQ